MKILKMFSNGKCIQLIDRDMVGACFYNDDRINFMIGGSPLSTRVHYSDFLNIINNWDNEKYDEMYLNSFPEPVKEEEIERARAESLEKAMAEDDRLSEEDKDSLRKITGNDKTQKEIDKENQDAMDKRFEHREKVLKEMEDAKNKT